MKLRQIWALYNHAKQTLEDITLNDEKPMTYVERNHLGNFLGCYAILRNVRRDDLKNPMMLLFYVANWYYQIRATWDGHPHAEKMRELHKKLEQQFYGKDDRPIAEYATRKSSPISGASDDSV